MMTRTTQRVARPTALLLVMSLTTPLLIGCGGKKEDTANIPPPRDASGGGSAMAPNPGTQTAPPQQRSGISGKQVAVVLGGAALLYYLYKRHQKQNGQEVQYYKSKNGRIYYRDAQTHQAIYVTPAASYQVTPQEQQELSRYQGYNNTTGGEDYTPAGAQDAGGAPQ